MLLFSIQQTGADNPALVKNTLAGGTFDSSNGPVVTGPMTFDANHDPIKSAVVMQVSTEGSQWIAAVPPP